MRAASRLAVLLFAVAATALAQEQVRFTSSPGVIQIRVEIASAGGTTLYDSDWKSGNVFDWGVADGFGHPLAYGTYRLRISSRDLEGRLSEKETTLQVAADRIAIDPSAGSEIKLTTTAHDGTTGQLITTSGDLSFRFGDFLNRKDTEAMRLSPEGNLDVKGWIRPGQGIVFADGSVLSSASAPSLMRTRASRPPEESTDAKLHPKTDVTGTGTTNQVTKWVDTIGTLGDSAVSESGGAVKIGTVASQGQLQIAGAANQDIFSGMGPNIVAGPAFNFGYGGLSFGVGAGFFNVRPASGATGVNPSLRLMTINVERMIITNAGDVGIGTSAPGQKLDVIGGIRSNAAIDAGTQFNLMGQRIMSAPGASNLFVGLDSGTASVTNAFQIASVGTGTAPAAYEDTFVGTSAGASNTLGSANSFVGARAGQFNTAGSSNSYFGDAAGWNATGGENSYFGYAAGSGNPGFASGNANSYFGYYAGAYSANGNFNSAFGVLAGQGTSGTTGSKNSSFGYGSGSAMTTGSNNAFLGYQAGAIVSGGFGNVYVGYTAGLNTTTGGSNTAVGNSAGKSTTTTASNTFIGALADAGSSLTNATAIGANSYVTATNSLVLGSVAGANGASTTVNVGIGTTAPNARLHVATGDAAITTQGNGLILRATDGTLCYRLTVNNVGAVSTAVVTCP
jgi:hypothetical protein